MDQFQLPTLAPPGAGIPWFENFVLRYFYFPKKLKSTTWEKNLDRLQKETQKILLICEGLTEQNFQTRKLIDRLRGMEDSSRFWSPALTIEHLLITLKGMTHIATELAQGKKPSIEVSTASVKPKQEDVTNKPIMLDKLKSLSENCFSQLKTLQSNHSNQFRLEHPWFGPITSEGWVWVLAQHQALHRKQIQMIVAQL